MQRQRHCERAYCAIMLTCSHLSFSKAEENISARRRPFRNWTRRVEVNHRLQHFFVRMFPKGFGLNLFILQKYQKQKPLSPFKNQMKEFLFRKQTLTKHWNCPMYNQNSQTKVFGKDFDIMTQFLSVDAENRASSHQLPSRTSLIYQSFDQHFLKNLAEPQKGTQKLILKANNTLLSSQYNR